MILSLLILVPMVACLAPVVAAAPALLHPDETGCTVKAYQGSVVIKISSSNPQDILNIQANGTFVAYCDREAALRQSDHENHFHVSLTRSGSCVFIIYYYDGNRLSVNITSATSTITEILVQGKPISNCFRPSFVFLNLKGNEEWHQQKLEVPVWAIGLVVVFIKYKQPCSKKRREKKDCNVSSEDDHRNEKKEEIPLTRKRRGRKDSKASTEDGRRKGNQKEPPSTVFKPSQRPSTRKRVTSGMKSNTL
ncbi:hypothetical protein MAR_017530 [Mya arenaria]|uniref:Uncharacterized protein n=1 Tax=Mya arenaria TaxID=6604 RepID=A0ABY7EFJ0_MYAAR|nr:hypothetical protein MAR_017530 [Mya arenaria]